MYNYNALFVDNNDDSFNGSLNLFNTQLFISNEIDNIDSKLMNIKEEPSEPIISGISAEITLKKEQNNNSNDNSLNKINNDLINNKDQLEIKKQKKEISQLNKKRQRRGETKGKNNFSDENIRRKVKQLILDSLMNYINDKIVEKYHNNIGKGIIYKKNIDNKSRTKIEFYCSI